MAVASRVRLKHHSVYVVLLRNVRGDGRDSYYVGMTGLPVDQRFDNHKKGIKASSYVRRFGVTLVPELFEHLNPMRYEEAVERERELAEKLRRQGHEVYGGH
jgi:predicted GIY-YIG superfamily endonuclease